MTIAVILGASDVRLWGLTSRERLARLLAEVGVTEAPSVAQADPTDAILLLHQDYLYEPRTLSGLVESHQPGSARGNPSHEEPLQPGSTRGNPAHEEPLQPGSARGNPAHEEPPQPGSARGNPAHEASGNPTQLAHAAAPYVGSADEGLAPTGTVLMDGGTPAAAIVAAADAPAATALLTGAPGHQLDHLPRIGVKDLGAFEGELRKAAPPLLKPITAQAAPALEERLYGASYKGITDFVTKWWWPVPAKAAVRFCADRRISPNSVTVVGFLLMLASCWLFYAGWLGLGLVSAWVMTFLDTVDGKLARVTVQSSRFGHALDHGMDILHPPFWYWLWGLSLLPLDPTFGLDFAALMWCILIGYIGGRAIEGAFYGLGDATLFAWRPFDAYFRLFTARRNPCLVLLTAGWLGGAPEVGFGLVAIWTLLSTLVLLWRLLCACAVRLLQGPLTSWLARPDAAQRHPRAHRTFASTRRAYGS